MTALYVAALYAGAIALARRASIEVPWRIAALFYLLVLLFFFKPMTGPYVNVGPDVLQLIPPWSASAPPGFDKFDVANYELQDVMFQFVPWTHQVHESWRSLRVPLWNPLAGCGMPFLGNMQSGALSPLRLLTIPLEYAHAMTAEAAMKVLVALTFTFLFCRRRYGVLPSVIGAIAFGFCTFLMVWLHFPHPNVAALLPAVLFQIDLLAEKRTFGRFVFAGALGPMLLAGGHPETVAHVVFVAALYALWVIFVDRAKIALTLLAACVVAALLSAPVVAPFLEVLPHTSSYHDATAQGRGGGTAFSDFKSLALLVHPRLYGERPAPLWGHAVTENVSGFAGILGIGAWVALLIRAVVQRRWRERETFFLLAALLMFIIVADVPLVSAPFRELFSLALNARFRLPLAFFLAVLTAAFVQLVRREWVAAAIAAGAAALALVLLKSDVPREAWLMALPSAIVLAITALLAIERLRPFVIPLLALAIYAELWSATHSWHPVTRGTDLFPRTPLIDALLRARSLAGSGEPYRVAGIGAPLFPNTHVPFGLEDVRAKDAITSARYIDLLKTATRHFDPYAYYQKWNDPDTSLLDFLNVRWVITEPGMQLGDRTRYRAIYEGPDGRVYENANAKARFFADGAEVRITRARGGAYDLLVAARQRTQIVSSVAWWPGWRVSYNGRDIETQVVYGAFLGFDVPPGRGVVQVRYVPMSFWGSLVLAGMTIAGLVIIRARV